MDDRQGQGPVGVRTDRARRGDGLAEELWASALLVGLAVAATVGLALLAHLLLRSGT